MTTGHPDADDMPTDRETEAAKFLERDYTQCFQQARHYDALIVDVTKFAFGAYAVISGAALGAHRYGLETSIDYRGPAVAVAVVGFVLGLTLLALVVRYRTYFVKVTRYLNEHRAFFLKAQPLGFANDTGMYMDAASPPYFNWISSQALLLYALAFMNSGLLGMGLYIFICPCRWWIGGTTVVVVMAVQLLVAIVHLTSQETHGRAANSDS